VSTKATIVGPCLFIALLAAPALTIASGGTASAAEECLAAPDGTTPKGLHWFYRLDPQTRQKCWYLRDPAVKPDSAAKPDPAAKADSAAKPDSAAQAAKPVTPKAAAEPGALSFGAAPAAAARPATTAPATRGLTAAAQSDAASPADSPPTDSLGQRWPDQTSGITQREPALATTTAAPIAVEPGQPDTDETLSAPPPAAAVAAPREAQRGDTAGHALAILGGVALAALSALAAARLVIRQRDVLYRPGLHLQSGPRPGAFGRAAVAPAPPEPTPAAAPREVQGVAATAGEVAQVHVARAPERAPAPASAVPEDLEESLRSVMRALKRAAG
jgi:hypothetical protein